MKLSCRAKIEYEAITVRVEIVKFDEAIESWFIVLSTVLYFDIFNELALLIVSRELK